jgi:hypothetical protein
MDREDAATRRSCTTLDGDARERRLDSRRTITLREPRRNPSQRRVLMRFLTLQ